MTRRLEQRSRLRQPRRSARLLAALVLIAGGLCGGVSSAATAQFDRYEAITGEQRETVLVGRFLSGPFVNVALVGADEQGGRHLRIFALADGAWKPALDASLGAGTLFVDVAASASAGGQIDRLITYQRGRLNWFDPESMTERLLLPLDIDYRTNDETSIPAIDIAQDLNGDGLDDLLAPAADGFWISTQAQTGTFAEPTKLGPGEPYLAKVALGEARPYGQMGINPTNFPWYAGRVHRADYDRDGLPDLVFWNEDRFDVHFQNRQRQFEPVAKSFHGDLPFDVDGTYTLMFEYSDESTWGLILGLRKKTRITMLHELRDINGDGIADLTTLSLQGRSLANHRGTYRAHFGRATPGGTAFSQEADVTIEPKGKAGALNASGYSSVWSEDFDGDGDADVLFRDVSVGLFGMARAMAGKSVALDVEFYRMQDGSFPRRATQLRKIRPRLYPVGSGVFFPPVLIGDVHGDGRVDLVVGQSREELQVFAGVDAPGAFERRPQRVSVALPDDERNTRLVDLNDDGKQDILVYNTFTKPHRLTTLVAR